MTKKRNTMEKVYIVSAEWCSDAEHGNEFVGVYDTMEKAVNALQEEVKKSIERDDCGFKQEDVVITIDCPTEFTFHHQNDVDFLSIQVTEMNVD